MELATALATEQAASVEGDQDGDRILHPQALVDRKLTGETSGFAPGKTASFFPVNHIRI
jgi:hypothetical protein